MHPSVSPAINKEHLTVSKLMNNAMDTVRFGWLESIIIIETGLIFNETIEKKFGAHKITKGQLRLISSLTVNDMKQ